MRIALIGAAGSGKTELAHELQDSLGGTDVAQVVDGYSAMCEETDVAVGHSATYINNMIIACERMMCESLALTFGTKYVITCGTLIETILYTALWGVQAQKFGDGTDTARMIQALDMLSLMLKDTWTYDIALWLPYNEDKKEELDGNQDVILDGWIPTALDEWKVPYVELRHDHQLDDALNSIEKHEAETTEQPRV